MIKVYLTTGYTTPPMTYTYECDRVSYKENTQRLNMYVKSKNGKEKLYRFAYADEWLHVSYIDETGKEIIIK